MARRRSADHPGFQLSVELCRAVSVPYLAAFRKPTVAGPGITWRVWIGAFADSLTTLIFTPEPAVMTLPHGFAGSL